MRLNYGELQRWCKRSQHIERKKVRLKERDLEVSE